MKKSEIESLIAYVSDMVERREEYDYENSEVVRDLNNYGSETAEKISEIYGNMGVGFCKECEKYNLYDEEEDEYYCPIHGS